MSGIINLADEKLYRIERLKYAEPFFRERKLVLVSPGLWEDPFEYLVPSCGFDRLDGNGKYQQYFFDRQCYPVFSQCWTLTAESDAMWRIYSHVPREPELREFANPDEGLRLMTTGRKLFEAVTRGLVQIGARREDVFLMRVNYVLEEQFTQDLANYIGNKQESAFAIPEENANFMAYKRTPFSHEAEVRVIFVDSERRFEGKPIVSVDVDPSSIIEEVTVDPRLVNAYAWKRFESVKSWGYAGAINRSMLYQKNLFMIRIPSVDKAKS